MTSLKKLSKKGYRDVYLPSRVRGTIAMQVRALRKALRLSQKAFASLIGTTQSAVSDLENPDGDQVSVQTLLNVAAAADVALVVRFASYPDFLKLMGNMSPEGLAAERISDTIRKQPKRPAAVPVTAHDIVGIQLDVGLAVDIAGAMTTAGSMAGALISEKSAKTEGAFKWQTIQGSRQPFVLPISGMSTPTTAPGG